MIIWQKDNNFIFNFKSIKMKTLGKLNINSEKLLKHEELKNLKGGWDGECATWHEGSYTGVQSMTGLQGSSAAGIDADCAHKLGTGNSCFCNYF